MKEGGRDKKSVQGSMMYLQEIIGMRSKGGGKRDVGGSWRFGKEVKQHMVCSQTSLERWEVADILNSRGVGTKGH